MAPFTVSGLTGVLTQVLPEPHAGLMAGLLFGTKAQLPADFYDALVTSGTLHIIALSGMNITIMTDLIGVAATPVVGKRRAAVITAGIIAWFVSFVGFGPSIVRAAMMGLISLMAVLYGRRYWAVLSLIITAGVMLCIRPAWIADVSFQLSVFASLGIILFGHTKSHVRNSGQTGSTAVVRRAVLVVRDDIHLTLAAQVFTIPLILFRFRRISLISPLANVAIGWVIAPLTLLGWGTVLSGWLVLYAGQVLAWFDWILLEYLIRTIYFVSSLPFAGIAW